MTKRTRVLVDELMRSEEPSIRWKTRVHVLGEGPTGARSRSLQKEIRGSARVRALLSRQDRLGRAGTARGVYYKWQGAHWVLASLADIGYPRGDRALWPMRDRVLDLWLDPSAYREFEAATKAAAYRGGRGVPLMQGRYRRCGSQQGNALYSVITLGIADARAADLAERLLHWQWPDGGWNCDRDPSADTSSFMETLTPMTGLHAYAEISKDSQVKRAVARAAEVFLRRSLFKRATDGTVIHPDFVALHYPLYWHYDVLGGLKSMRRIGKLKDARCREALDLLEAKELPAGGWPAEKRHYSGSSKAAVANKDHVDWGPTGRARRNDWVTVDALSVLVSARRISV